MKWIEIVIPRIKQQMKAEHVHRYTVLILRYDEGSQTVKVNIRTESGTGLYREFTFVENKSE